MSKSSPYINNGLKYSPKKQSNNWCFNDNKQIECIDNDYISDIQLTKRQSEVLFYLLKGKAIKQIARILKISNRTADGYLEQLRVKFAVHTKQELIIKAIRGGF